MIGDGSIESDSNPQQCWFHSQLTDEYAGIAFGRVTEFQKGLTVEKLSCSGKTKKKQKHVLSD